MVTMKGDSGGTVGSTDTAKPAENAVFWGKPRGKRTSKP